MLRSITILPEFPLDVSLDVRDRSTTLGVFEMIGFTVLPIIAQVWLIGNEISCRTHVVIGMVVDADGILSGRRL